jgi:hypothetical protein
VGHVVREEEVSEMKKIYSKIELLEEDANLNSTHRERPG